MSHIAQHQCNPNEIQNMKVLNEESRSERLKIGKIMTAVEEADEFTGKTWNFLSLF